MFETQQLYLLRKPVGVPTTRGKDECFLDGLREGFLDTTKSITNFPHFIEAFEEIKTIIGAMGGNMHEARDMLLEDFSAGEEYGLLNRLDTDTSGMLYFARSRDVYKNWRDLQKKGYVEKYYLAQVWGDVGRNVEKCIDKEIKDACYVSVQENNQDIVLRFPLMHHKHDVERMVSCATVDGLEKLGTKGRGNLLEAISRVTPLSYDPVTNTSIVRVVIRQGWRHQIRVHLATLGNPIVGDRLYGGKDACDASVQLQLVSCGARVEVV